MKKIFFALLAILLVTTVSQTTAFAHQDEMDYDIFSVSKDDI